MEKCDDRKNYHEELIGFLYHLFMRDNINHIQMCFTVEVSVTHLSMNGLSAMIVSFLLNERLEKMCT